MKSKLTALLLLWAIPAMESALVAAAINQAADTWFNITLNTSQLVLTYTIAFIALNLPAYYSIVVDQTEADYLSMSGIMYRMLFSFWLCVAAGSTLLLTL